MSDYRRIDNVSETASVYAEIVNVFGKAVFLDKYRTIGAFTDIAPKLKEESSYLMKAFDAGVPQFLAGASGLSEDKGKELAAKLKGQGLSEDIALDLMENLCQAVGIEANVRPDYSKGGMIPYVSKEGEGLREAIEKLDHIRWFLNNSGKYQLHGSEKELTEMRRLMGNPQRNETELKDRYNQLVHKFQNDPFAEVIVFGKKPDAGITSKDFGAYFIVVEGTPVALEFARPYGGEAYTGAARNLKTKYDSMSRKIDGYYKEASAIDLPLNNAGKKRKAFVFIIVALVIINYMKKMLTGRWEGAALLTFWSVLKENHFAIWKVLPGISSVSYPISYSVVLVVSLLLLWCVVVLLLNLCKTLWNVCKVKGTKRLYKKKDKLIMAFGKTIPNKLESLMEQMNQYLSGKKSALEISVHDYSDYVDDMQSLKNEKASTGMDSFIPGAGSSAFVWMIIFAVALWVMGGGQLKSEAVVCASELGDAVTLREAVSETVIPQNALKYGKHFYAVFDDAPTWEAAFDQCEKLGGHLVTITSEEEEIAVASYLKNKDVEWAFIGLKYTDTGEKSSWRWLGKKKASYKDWADDEPDLGDEGDCLYGAFSRKDDYKWRALPKDYTTYYVCEWNSLDAAKVDKRLLKIPCGSMKYNGHYYAVLNGAETYDDAVKMCEKLGGYLCMIDGGKENKALYKYIHSYGHEDVYFGYSDQNLEGKWVWAYTDAPGEFTKWSDGEPNGDAEENYGMFYSGSDKYCWNDKSWDGEDSLFLCEWDPKQWDSQTEAE